MTTYSKKVVLSCPTGSTPGLESLVEDFIKQGVTFVAVVGEDCSRIEDIIDETVVGDGSDDKRFILTSSHPNQTVVGDCIKLGGARNNLDDSGTAVSGELSNTAPGIEVSGYNDPSRSLPSSQLTPTFDTVPDTAVQI